MLNAVGCCFLVSKLSSWEWGGLNRRRWLENHSRRGEGNDWTRAAAGGETILISCGPETTWAKNGKNTGEARGKSDPSSELTASRVGLVERPFHRSCSGPIVGEDPCDLLNLRRHSVLGCLEGAHLPGRRPRLPHSSGSLAPFISPKIDGEHFKSDKLRASKQVMCSRHHTLFLHSRYSVQRPGTPYVLRRALSLSLSQQSLQRVHIPSRIASL
jgi:hypothetical protein